MQTIHLHIDQKSEIPKLYAKQRDVGRKFKAVITDGSDDYQIPDGIHLSVWYSGTSGEGHYSAIGANSAFLVEGNTITVELITQMLTNKGGGTLCLEMNAADGTQIGLWNIPYYVEGIPGADSEEAQQHFDAFSEVTAQALDAAKRAEQAAQTLAIDETLSATGQAADAGAVGTALAGKAPAGYGLGGGATNFNINNIDNMKSNGWFYSSKSDGYYIGTVPIYYLHLRVDSWKDTISAVRVVQTMYFDGIHEVQRTFFENEWGEWEWVNPPMTPGVEYRTTERWEGYPVYCKLVNCGTYVNGKTTSVKFSGSVRPIRYCGFYGYNGAYDTVLNANSINVVTNEDGATVNIVMTGSTLESTTTNVAIYYIKP